jgi:hypothetical protein
MAPGPDPGLACGAVRTGGAPAGASRASSGRRGWCPGLPAWLDHGGTAFRGRRGRVADRAGDVGQEGADCCGRDRLRGCLAGPRSRRLPADARQPDEDCMLPVGNKGDVGVQRRERPPALADASHRRIKTAATPRSRGPWLCTRVSLGSPGPGLGWPADAVAASQAACDARVSELPRARVASRAAAAAGLASACTSSPMNMPRITSPCWAGGSRPLVSAPRP